jgi:hypothetical protein
MVNAAGVKHGGRTQHLGAASNRHRPARQGENTFARPYISGMKTYRLDPKNPPRLTDEEERRLDETPIDYSDIPKLGDEFFSRAKHPPEKLAEIVAIVDDETMTRKRRELSPEEARRRALRFLFCCSCGTLHLGDPAATTDLCANCQGSKFRLASVEMVTQPIPSVRWPRPFSAEDIEKIERAARGGG